MRELIPEYPNWRWAGRRARCICWRLSCKSPRQIDGSLGAPCSAGVRSLAGGHVCYVVKEAASRLRECSSRSHRVGMEPGTPLFLHAAEGDCGRQLPERAEPRPMPFHPWRFGRNARAFPVWLRRTRWSPANSHAGCGRWRAPRRRQARGATRRPELRPSAISAAVKEAAPRRRQAQGVTPRPICRAYQVHAYFHRRGTTSMCRTLPSRCLHVRARQPQLVARA